MLSVRSMKQGDEKAVAALEKQIFSDAWSERGIADTFRQSQAFVLVAECEEKIVGYCIVYHVLDEAEIARIGVDPLLRRQGIGQELLRATCRVCMQQGIARLLLDVRESNVAARTFYSNFGFEEDGIRKNFYQNPREHAVLMSMSIG